MTTAAARHPLDRSAKIFWLSQISLLLVYFGMRAFRLAALPPHIDEVFHVTRALDVWNLDPLYFIWNTKLLNIWLIALFYPFANAFWVARIVSVFAGLVTLACIYKLGALLYSRGAGLLAAYLYLVLPLTFWHDRIAISDPVSTATGALVVLSGVMLARSPSWGQVALAAAALAAAYLSKITMLLLWPAPGLAWLLLRPRHSWFDRPDLSRLGAAYGLGLLLISPIVAYSAIYSDLGLYQLQHRSEIGLTLPSQLLQNSTQLFAHVRLYLGILVAAWLIVTLVAGLVARNRRGYFLLLASLLPIAALLAVGTRNDTRYYLVGLPPLLALMGIGGILLGRWLRERLPERVRGLGALVAGIILLAPIVAYWPFYQGTYADAASVGLPPQDYRTYISSYSAGFGWDATTEWLRRAATTSERPITVVAPVEGHAMRTEVALANVSSVSVLHPEELTADWLAAQMSGNADVYLVRDEPRPEIDWEDLGVEPELVQTFPRPDGNTWVDLYLLTPAREETEP